MNVDQQLRDQNNGTSWRDCNLARRPRPHRWTRGQTVNGSTYWQCQRCPVGTRTAVTDQPDRFLRTLCRSGRQS